MSETLDDASEQMISLGYYDFSDVFVSHWRDIKGYPKNLILIHETHHKALTETTLYGNISLLYNNVVKEAEQINNDYLPSLQKVFTYLLQGAFDVHEGNATYVELIAAATHSRDLYDMRLRSLPPAYRQATEQFIRALGSPTAAAQGNFALWAVAVTVSKLCCNANVFLELKDWSVCSPQAVSAFLAKHSPDVHLRKLVALFAKRSSPVALASVWNRLVIESAAQQGFSLSTKDGQPFYMDLPVTEREQLIMPVQDGFRKYLINEGLLTFSTLNSAEAVLDGARSVVESWQPHLLSIGLEPPMIIIKPPAERLASTKVHHATREPLPPAVVETLPTMTLNGCLDMCFALLGQNLMPILSFEQGNTNSHMVVLIFATPLQQLNATGDALRITGPALRAVLAKEEMVNQSFNRIRQALSTPFIPILWHFQAEVIPLIPRGTLSAIPCGMHLFSLSVFNAAQTVATCEAMAATSHEEGLSVGPVTVRQVGFRGSQYWFAVIQQHGGSWHHSFPCSGQEWSILREAVSKNPSIVFGRERIEATLGPLPAEHLLPILLAVAYRPLEWCL